MSGKPIKFVQLRLGVVSEAYAEADVISGRKRSAFGVIKRAMPICDPAGHRSHQGPKVTSATTKVPAGDAANAILSAVG